MVFCLRVDKLVCDVNLACEQTTRSVIENEKIGGFASNFDDIGAILKDALENGSDEYESDIEESGKVFDVLSAAGMKPRGVVVYGKRCRHIVARGVVSGDKISAEKMAEVRREISKIVGAELGEPTFEISKDGNIMLMHSKPTIRAYCAHGGADKVVGERSDDGYVPVDPFSSEIDSVCGDTTGAFLTDASYFYSLISDGMGSGREAAFTSSVLSYSAPKQISRLRHPSQCFSNDASASRLMPSRSVRRKRSLSL